MAPVERKAALDFLQQEPAGSVLQQLCLEHED
jgi:hypothetical protein